MPQPAAPQPQRTYYCVESSGSLSSSDHSTVQVQPRRGGNRQEPRLVCLVPMAVLKRSRPSRVAISLRAATVTPNKSPRPRPHQPTNHVPFLFKQRGSSAPAHQSRAEGSGRGRGPSGEQQRFKRVQRLSLQLVLVAHENRLALRSRLGLRRPSATGMEAGDAMERGEQRGPLLPEVTVGPQLSALCMLG